MMHPFNPFDATKAYAIGVHFQAFPFDFITVASRYLIGFNELPPTINTNVVLFTSLAHSYEYELIGTLDIVLKLTSIHTSIMQRQFLQFMLI
jgi:hypothetical protein